MIDAENGRTQLGDGLPALLPDFIARQRWFGGKGRRMGAATVSDLAWLPHAPSADALAIVDVSYDDAGRERYALWLGVRDEPGDLPLVGLLPGPRARAVVEAAGDRQSMRSFLAAFAREADLPTRAGGRIRFSDVTPEAARTMAAGPPVRALGADQSNTSIRIGDGLVFKLIRRLQPGENPELELGRFLTTRTSFTAISSLAGAVTYEAPDGTASTMGVLQAWVENTGDGWGYVVSRLTDHLAGAGSWRSVGEEMFSLGAASAGLHAALASDTATPAFAPEPVTLAAVVGWSQGLATRARRTLTELGVAAAALDGLPALLEALQALASGRMAAPPVTADEATRFHVIRVHGDYHLGQTLKTPAGFVLVDFEGEPTRPIAERRQKHCALKDVAGMLRSFEYAMAVACAAVPGQIDDLRSDVPMRRPFLDGYFTAAAGADAVFLPADRAAAGAWIRFFELDKALYELEYELSNRPTWARIPASGILRLTSGGA